MSAQSRAASLDYTATINPKSVLVEQFEGWGTSLCWWANVLGNDTNREQYADLAFKQLQLNIVRYNIGGGENPALPHSMESRARVPGFEPQSGVWDWNADANQRWFLRAAVARMVNRVVAFANSPPYWMTVSGSVTGATNGANNNLRVECETAFADYLVTVVSNLTRLDGVHFDTLTPMNEPGSDWWHYGNRQEGTHMSHDQQARMIQLLRPALARNGLQTGLVASEDNDEQRAINAVKSYDPATQKILSQIVTHTYTANNPTGIRKLADKLDKPVWISEYGDGEASGLQMARRIRDDLVQTHACAWVYWQFAEPDSNWGLIRYHRNNRNGTNSTFSLNKKFYVMSQFSNFVRPGFQILDVDDKNSLAAYDPAQHRLVIVTINDRKQLQPFTVTFDLSSFRTGDAKTTSYRTSTNENMQAIDSAFIREGKLITTMPPRSITTQVITGVFLRE
ncbi:MAG TPA: glycoside hydrolase [Verrucomicrobiae bacterium]|jgi:galactan endo-1,6-beta-galactosidase